MDKPDRKRDLKARWAWRLCLDILTGIFGHGSCYNRYETLKNLDYSRNCGLTNTLTCPLLAHCPPSVHISFDKFSQGTLLDDSGSINNAFIANGAQIEPHAGKCGNAVNLLGTSINSLNRELRQKNSFTQNSSCRPLLTKGKHQNTFFKSQSSAALGRVED
jgi:hypothetical protein